MKERLRKLYAVATAGLLHDVGKLLQRADDESIQSYLTNEAKIIESTACPPHWSGKGYRTHKHVLWTAAFWQEYSPHLPVPRGEQVGDHEMDTAENISAFHHNPTSGHPWQSLMQIADHCSAGMDRSKALDADSDQRGGNFRSTRLIPPWTSQQHTHELPLIHLSPKDQTCFPQKANLSFDRTSEYLQLAERLRSLVATMGICQDEQKDQGIGIPSEFVEIRYEALQSILEHTTWCIPSSTIDIPDISLFDHSRGTAAIAAALADFAMDDNGAIDPQKFEEKAFRFLVVDLAGIQQFIYDMNPSGFKGMSKVLRARSFFVNAMLEAVEIALLDLLELPRSQTIMYGGGKLILLISARQKHVDTIRSLQDRLDEALIKQTHGRLRIFFGIGEDFGRHAFLNGTLQEAYQSAYVDLAVQKLRPFANLLSPAERARADLYPENMRPCDACGKMEAKHSEGGDGYCEICYTQKKLGERLVRNPVIQFETAVGKEDFPGTNLKIELLESPRLLNSTRRVYRQWDGQTHTDVFPVRYQAHYVPRENEEVKSFETLAKIGIKQIKDGDSRGINALGVLTADVDNLGERFKGLLKRPKGGFTSMLSISRLLNFFFGGVLEAWLRARQDNIYTVYAGGDDMFFIGTWDNVLEAAGQWRDLFDQFTCGQQHFSAGLALAKPGVPVHRLHEEAEEQLKQAKSRDRKGKNRVCIWSRDLPWPEWQHVVSAKKKLVEWRLDDTLNTGQAYRLLNYSRRARHAEIEQTNLIEDAMWLPHMRYDIARNLKDKEAKKDLYEYVHALTTDNRTQFAKYYDIALTWALYQTRSAGERKEK